MDLMQVETLHIWHQFYADRNALALINGIYLMLIDIVRIGSHADRDALCWIDLMVVETHALTDFYCIGHGLTKIP